jgi:hypothetical protein
MPGPTWVQYVALHPFAVACVAGADRAEQGALEEVPGHVSGVEERQGEPVVHGRGEGRLAAHVAAAGFPPVLGGLLEGRLGKVDHAEGLARGPRTSGAAQAEGAAPVVGDRPHRARGDDQDGRTGLVARLRPGAGEDDVVGAVGPCDADGGAWSTWAAVRDRAQPVEGQRRPISTTRRQRGRAPPGTDRMSPSAVIRRSVDSP